LDLQDRGERFWTALAAVLPRLACYRPLDAARRRRDRLAKLALRAPGEDTSQEPAGPVRGTACGKGGHRIAHDQKLCDYISSRWNSMGLLAFSGQVAFIIFSSLGLRRPCAKIRAEDYRVRRRVIDEVDINVNYTWEGKKSRSPFAGGAAVLAWECPRQLAIDTV